MRIVQLLKVQEWVGKEQHDNEFGIDQCYELLIKKQRCIHGKQHLVK